MGWQEEQHRRNVAEAAQTRARIDQSHREMRARTEAANARTAADSQARHQDFMKAISTPTPSYLQPGNSRPAASASISGASLNSAFAPANHGGGQTKKPSKYDRVLGLFFLLALAVWCFGNGHAALVVAGIGIGLVLLAAVIALTVATLKALIRALPKLIGIGVVCLVIYLVLNHR